MSSLGAATRGEVPLILGRILAMPCGLHKSVPICHNAARYHGDPVDTVAVVEDRKELADQGAPDRVE